MSAISHTSVNYPFTSAHVCDTYALLDPVLNVPELFWSEIGKMATLDRQLRFSLLHQLMAGLLSPMQTPSAAFPH